MEKNTVHIPVLLNESIDLLGLESAKIVLDATLGFAGHSSRMLEIMSKDAKLIGIDQDPVALNYSKEKIGHDSRVLIIEGNYGDLDRIVLDNQVPPIDACLVDCGISSVQLDSPKRGFSFQTEGDLDMRMSPKTDLTAAEILNSYSRADLERVLTEYGECRAVHKFLDVIESFRENQPFQKVPDLVACIKKGFFFRNKRSLYIRTCTQVFQALRIEVNQELGYLEDFLGTIMSHLAIGGVCAIISFHSLEDRLVKRFIREQKNAVEMVNKKVIQVSYHQAKSNTRARSAKLRAFRRLI